MVEQHIEEIAIAVLLPFLYILCLQFTKEPQKWINSVSYVVLIDYIVILFSFAVLFREERHEHVVLTILFRDYNNEPSGLLKDNIINVLAFIPIGLLSSVISEKFVIPKSALLGLFVSETIECCQLIYRRGAFDINDLLNNTIGALAGALIYLFICWLYRISIREQNEHIDI